MKTGAVTDAGPQEFPCAGKLAYPTQKAATGGAAAVKWQHGTKLKPYRCRYCGLWHLASV
jgi:hypothetical protein